MRIDGGPILPFEVDIDWNDNLTIRAELTEEVAKEFLEGRGYTVVE